MWVGGCAREREREREREARVCLTGAQLAVLIAATARPSLTQAGCTWCVALRCCRQPRRRQATAKVRGCRRVHCQVRQDDGGVRRHQRLAGHGRRGGRQHTRGQGAGRQGRRRPRGEGSTPNPGRCRCCLPARKTSRASARASFVGTLLANSEGWRTAAPWCCALNRRGNRAAGAPWSCFPT